jgi:signal transduction histidine kinase
VEDALFVQSLADFLATGYQNERILNLMKQVRQQNFELVEKNNSIAALNEEQASLNEELTSLNDQLSIVNESLEEAVKRRTAELEQQNKQLTEYAFINSHLLRAPLARLMGLAQLTTLEVTTVKEKELLHALEASAGELDQIIRKISDLLYKGNDISRDDVKEIIQRNFNDLK